MKRIGVVSDTHGEWKLVAAQLGQQGQLDLLCHGGDFFADGVAMEMELGVKSKLVMGNCDGSGKGPREQIFQVADRIILLTHGHQYGVKYDLQRLLYRALEVEASIVIYGHTHIPMSFTKEQILFLNPGSPVQPRGRGRGSYGIIEIAGDKVEGKIIEIKY